MVKVKSLNPQEANFVQGKYYLTEYVYLENYRQVFKDEALFFRSGTTRKNFRLCAELGIIRPLLYYHSLVNTHRSVSETC